MKSFKKNYSKFTSNGNARNDGACIGYKGRNLYTDKNKGEGVKNYYKYEEKKKKTLLEDSRYDYNYFNRKNHFAKDYVKEE